MQIEPESDAVTVVLVGRFNPAIFQPQWFGHHGLILPSDADEAQIEIIHPEISKFRVGKFELSVETERLVIQVSSPPFIDVADFLERTFRGFLSHTPINRMGINRHVHFNVGSEDARNEIGMKLAPHKPWGEWAGDLERPHPNRGGLRVLVMEERGLEDRPDGHFQIKVEPSRIIKRDAGIFAATNDDYIASGYPKNVEGCEEILDLLRDKFDTSMSRAERIIDLIMSLKP